MKKVLIHHININPQTDFNKIRFDLLLEKRCDNFFSHSINYFNDLKNQCPNLCENNFHLFLPHEHEDTRPIESLPCYENQSKKYLNALFYVNNNMNFNSFIKNYKDFIKRINGRSTGVDFFSNIEIFMRENTVPYSEISELPYDSCGSK